MTRWQYRHGLQEIGEGCYAYLQPDGSWGWSNAGLITDGEASLLVDTLYDLPRTQAMLDAMADATEAARDIDAVVNTHANGDHCFGNKLLERKTILATAACADEMPRVTPAMMQRNKKLARVLSRLPWPLSRLPMGQSGATLKEFGQFLLQTLGTYEYEGNELVLPNKTFRGAMTWQVGDQEVELMEVGPAHTRGDALVFVPDCKVVYTGDILFHGGHPIVWEGPVGNWIAACDRILQMDVEVVVPGHGPIGDKAAIRSMKQYLEYIHREARERHDAGMPAVEAARDIALTDYAEWGEAERIVVNVHTLYREFDGVPDSPSPKEMFGLMAALAAERRR